MHLGFESRSPYFLVNQYYGSIEQYWRHNFDETLQILNGQYVFHSAKGEAIQFFSLGQSASYPTMHLELLSNGDENILGYRLLDSNSAKEKIFDTSGRLRKIRTSGRDTLTLHYDEQSRLESVKNEEGEWLEFDYAIKPRDSIYSLTESTHLYPIKITNNNGETVSLEWDRVHEGLTAKFHLLTFIGDPRRGESNSGRAFAYNDSRWPASLTDIYTVLNASLGLKQLYAHFEYDGRGRAVYSELANGVDATTLKYPSEDLRIATNSLGKSAVYQFGEIGGARRLLRVTGEPTESCLQSEVEYIYDPTGNLNQMIKNGVVTNYSYDEIGREITRTEAANTDEGRTISTEWHSTLPLKTRVIEPGRETVYIYDEEGRLTGTSVNPLPAQ